MVIDLGAIHWGDMLLTGFGAVITFLFGLMRQMLAKHMKDVEAMEKRLSVLENTAITKQDLELASQRIEKLIDAGFRHFTTRIDDLFTMLSKGSRHE